MSDDANQPVSSTDTEIDWVAYMEQVKQFLDGERNYVRIEGGTGPLVYPAAHVYTYTALYRITNNGENILLAQQIFAGLYLATLALVMACYKKANVGSLHDAKNPMRKKKCSLFAKRRKLLTSKRT